MHRFGLKPRLARRHAQQISALGQIKIDELATTGADCMIMPFGFAIIAAGAVAKSDFMNQTRFLQVAQGVVNGRKTD